MTTPHQSPDQAMLKSWVGSGAFVVDPDNSETNYGQGTDEEQVRALFEVPAISAGSAMATMKDQLRKMPVESLRTLKPILPDVTDEDFADSETAAETIVGKADQKPPLRDLLDHITREFLGRDDLENTWLDQARDAMGKIFADLAQNTRSIQDLQAKEAGSVAQGKVINIDFADYPDGPIPNTLFDVIYEDISGPSTSEIGIQDGLACWITKDEVYPRNAYVVAVEPTETDFQIIRGTMAAAPGDPTDTGKPYFYAIARVANDLSSYVWARAWSTGSWFQFRGDIGITINGVETVWQSDIPLTWSLDMSFVVGVGNNPHQYQVWSGSKLVVSYTDATESCPLGEGTRRWGSLATIRPGGAYGVHTSGKIAGCSVADNELPTVKGTTASFYRISTTDMSFRGGGVITPLPPNFWEIPSRMSSNLTFDPATGMYEIQDEGRYLIHGRVNVSDIKYTVAQLCLQVNGTTVQEGIPTFIGHGSDTGLFGSWVEYLYPGDLVNLATEQRGFTSDSINGDATGRRSFFEITGLD